MDRAELTQRLLATGCAEPRGGFVFLRDPHWTPAERSAVEALAKEAEKMPAPTEGWLCIRTGGTSGGLTFARHDEHTLTAAVAGFQTHFALSRVNTVGVLPPWHISGLMARVRSWITGGAYRDAAWKVLESGTFPPLDESAPWVISLVPTQLQRLLGSPSAAGWLRQFAIVFVGGGPVWPDLTRVATQTGVRVSLCYGMTETAAMVAAQQPEEFLAGDWSSAPPMPHARLSITEDGRVAIAGDSVFRGYFPHPSTGRTFVTPDLGRIDDRGRLHLLGRADAVIISGGKKINPAVVEATLRASGELTDVAVIGLPDPEWGEIVVACYPLGAIAPDLANAASALAPHERPKRCVAIANWPRNAQGKINRAALREQVMTMP